LVGVMAWARFEDVRFTLAPGDVLIYYTDGVTETHGTNGELFGADRLRDLVETCDGLSAEEIAERVEHGVDEFRGQYPDRDDVVVLVLKVSATT